MENLLADLEVDDTGNSFNTSYNTSYNDPDRTQPLSIVHYGLANSIMPPVPDSPAMSPTNSPKKSVTFATDVVRMDEKVHKLPPLPMEHDLSVHSMPELGYAGWSDASDDSDLTLASPSPKRKGEEFVESVDVEEDRVMLETVRNGDLVDQIVDLGIPEAESSILAGIDSSAGESVLYNPVMVKDESPKEDMENPFVDTTPQEYVLELPFEDMLYEPLESITPAVKPDTSATSVFDIWNNQSVSTTTKNKPEFDCINSPIKPVMKVEPTKLNVTVLNKRVYSNTSSVMDRLEVKPIYEQPSFQTDLLNIEFTDIDLSQGGFTVDSCDEYEDKFDLDASSIHSIEILKSVWTPSTERVIRLNASPTRTMLTHSDTFERLHVKTRSMVMLDDEAMMVDNEGVAGKIKVTELKSCPSQRAQYVEEEVTANISEEDIADLGISLPKGEISPARKTMVAKFEQSIKQMQTRREHEKLQETMKHALREKMKREIREVVVEQQQPDIVSTPIPNVLPVSAPVATKLFLRIGEIRNIRIPDLRKHNGKIQVLIDTGKHIVKTNTHPLDYHGVVKVNEEFEILTEDTKQLIITLKLSYDVPKDKVIYTQPKKQYKQVKSKWWKRSETVEIPQEKVKSTIKAADPIKGYIAPDGSFAKYKYNIDSSIRGLNNEFLSCFNEWTTKKVVENICTLSATTEVCPLSTERLSLACGDVVNSI